MTVESGHYRSKRDVERRFVRRSLLPQLGLPSGRGRGRARIADLRLDLSMFFRRLLFMRASRADRTDTVILPAAPGAIPGVLLKRLGRYVDYLCARNGILTNGREVRVYEKIPGGGIELSLQCTEDEIASRTEELRTVLRIAPPDGEEQAVEEPLATEEPPATLVGEDPADLPERAGEAAPEPILTSDEASSAEWVERPDPDREPAAEPEPSVEPAPATPAPRPERKGNMKVIAVYHNKGGVGKTTVAVNLAAALRNKGLRVLLVDLDSQSNATFAVGLLKFQFVEDDDIIQKYVYHILDSGDFDFIPEVVRKSRSFNTPEFDVIPSHIDLTNHQYRLTMISACRSRLFNKLERVRGDYDIVVIDAPPSKDLYAEIALASADFLIIPSDLRPFANQGLMNVRQFINEVNESRANMHREPVSVIGVLPSKISTNAQYNKYALPRQKQVVSERFGFSLMDTVIYERMPLASSLSRTISRDGLDIPDPKSIFDYCALDVSPTTQKAADNFRELADEVLEKAGWRE